MKILQKKIEEIAEVIAGQSPPSSTYNKEGKGLPFFQGKADYGVKYPKVRFWCSEPTKISLPDDILISVRAPVGPVNINDKKSCIGRGLTAIRVNNNISRDYVYFFLKINESKIAKLGVGSTFTSITQKDVKGLIVPIPDNLEDQIHIANILSKAEALINQRKESILLLDEFLKSTFIERFIKRNYALEKLGELSIKITDGEHKKPDYKESGMPFISVVNISKGSLNFDNCKFVSQEDHMKFNKRCNPEVGDILYTKVGATYGRAVIVDTRNPFSLYVSVALIKPNRKLVNPLFLKAAINHPFVKRQADKSIKGAGVPDLHLIEIKSFKIPFPPRKEQDEFASIVEKTETLKIQYQASLQELENLYGSLSQRAFKGELNQSKPVQKAYQPKNIPFYQMQVLGYIAHASKQKNINHGEMTLAKYLYLADKIYGVPTYFNYKRLHLGPYPIEIKKALSKKYFNHIKGDITVINEAELFKYNNPYKEQIIKVVDDLTALFNTYESKDRAHQTELLATVCKVVEDIQSTDLKAVRESMASWPIELKTSQFKNKAEKFGEEETKETLSAIVEKKWNQLLIQNKK